MPVRTADPEGRAAELVSWCGVRVCTWHGLSLVRWGYATLLDLSVKITTGSRMTANPMTNLTVAQLRRAVSIKQRIDQLEAELSSILGTSGGGRGRGTRRKMSRATKAKIAAAARARWARVKAGKK